MNTVEDVKMVETEEEAKALLDAFMADMGKKLTRKDAIEYSNKLIEAKRKGDFKGIKGVWESLGYKRFNPKDYAELVRPLITRDFNAVKAILVKAEKAKNLNELRRLTLPYPVVPPAFLAWKNGIKRAASIIVTKTHKQTLKKVGNTFTNKVGA